MEQSANYIWKWLVTIEPQETPFQLFELLFLIEKMMLEEQDHICSDKMELSSPSSGQYQEQATKDTDQSLSQQSQGHLGNDLNIFKIKSLMK